MSRRGWLLFIIMSVIWGTPYLLIRVAVRDLSPATLVFARTFPAAVLLLPLALRRGQLRPLLPQWRWIVAYTAVEIAIPEKCPRCPRGERAGASFAGSGAGSGTVAVILSGTVP